MINYFLYFKKYKKYNIRANIFSYVNLRWVILSGVCPSTSDFNMFLCVFWKMRSFIAPH